MTEPEAGYPVRLRVAGRPVVVAGGGAVALREVGRLRAAGARVVVISAEPVPELADQAARGELRLISGGFRDRDLEPACLVIACEDEPGTSAAVMAAADRLGVWRVSRGGSCQADRPNEDAPRPDGRSPGRITAARSRRRQRVPVTRGRRVLVLGGARSGKSAAAERMLAGGAVDYVATGRPVGGGDQDWDVRVGEHQRRRPASWRTTETLDLAGVLLRPDPEPVLVECLATWLARVMDDCGLWERRDGADSALASRVEELVRCWRQTGRHVIAVSNEVGSGVVPATRSGRRFRDELGVLNARVAEASEEVWLCTAGIAGRLR